MKNKKQMLINLAFVSVLILTFLGIFKLPGYLRTKAAGEDIPKGITHLQYLQALTRADTDANGKIEAKDSVEIASRLKNAPGASQFDFNFDKSTNGGDVDFVNTRVGVELKELEKTFMSDPKIAQEMNLEKVRNLEMSIPIGQDESLVKSSSGFSVQDSSGGDTQYGKDIIPKVLGTVSSYTGSADLGFGFEVPKDPGGLAPGLGLSYSSASIDDARPQGADGATLFYRLQQNYQPYFAGYGFSVTGLGSIFRDTKEKKSNTNIHRFILSLPGGVSAELKYNSANSTWVSLPQAFLDIRHPEPGKKNITFLDGKIGNVYDPNEWVITTKDGTKYYFGEADFTKKINSDGRIIGSVDYKPKNELIGSSNGNAYVEFGRINSGKDIMVTKWLLRRVEATDGREIDYNYEADQAFSGSVFVTTSTYPKSIYWNKAKYRVLFGREDRGDKGERDFMKSRLKDVRVEVQKSTDKNYALVRKYALSYYPDAEKHIDKISNEKNSVEKTANSWGISFLKSYQEFGTDDTTSLPSTSFSYSQIQFAGEDFSEGSVYLSTIGNGYGGDTVFKYEPYFVPMFDSTGVGREQHRRVRVTKKTIFDKVRARSSREEYIYSSPLGFVRDYGKIPGEKGGVAYEFLGHKNVEVKSFDFDEKILGHSEAFFNQVNTATGCFEPRPDKGQPNRSLIYLGDSKSNIVSEQIPTMRYRLDGKDGLDPSNCDLKRDNQPYFLYNYENLSIQNDAPKTIGNLGTSKSTIRTLTRNLGQDEFGNTTKGVNYGEVSAKNEDIDSKDNKYSYTYYLVGGASWLKSLPYLSYSSNIDGCDKINLSCQWGRSILYYDSFEDSYGSSGFADTDFADQKPVIGLVTMQKGWLDENTTTASRVKYLDLSGSSKDADNRKGGVIESYSPKPNLEKVTDIKNDLVLSEKTSYDPFYQTLPVAKENALGHKSKFSNYDETLGLPRTIETQIQKSPELFAIGKMEFDPLGRLTMSYSPDSSNPGKTLAEPSVLKRYYDNNGLGMITRIGKTVSQTVDGKRNYLYTDTFYDGVGQVLQSQILQTNVEGLERRLVTISDYHADGSQTETFEPQLADALVLTEPGSPAPQYLANVAKVKNSETVFDALRRPLTVSQINSSTGQVLKTTSDYALLMQKTTGPKGNVSASLSDIWGKVLISQASEASGQKNVITTNLYEKPMIDNVTKSTMQTSEGNTVVLNFDYDKAGRLLSSNDPSLGKYTYKFDVNGKKIFETSLAREDIAFKYDLLGRLIERNNLNIAPENYYKKTLRDKVTISYDESPYALGLPVKVTHLTGEKSMSYDGGQRVTSTTLKTFDVSKTFASTYNPMGQAVSSTYPDKTLVETTYDKEGRIAKSKINGVESFISSQYDKWGHQISSRVSDGVNNFDTASKFDNIGRLTGWTIAKGGQKIIKQDLLYNSYGEVENLTENLSGTQNTYKYGYNAFSQLASVDSNLYKASYNYDLLGRMLKKDEKEATTLTFDDKYPLFAPKKVTFDSASGRREQTLGYTAEGNLQSDEKNCYFYNRDGQMNKMGVKKTVTSACDKDENFLKIYFFYYDDSGSMNLQEEYLPTNLTKPVKQIYYFGTYEEEVSG